MLKSESTECAPVDGVPASVAAGDDHRAFVRAELLERLYRDVRVAHPAAALLAAVRSPASAVARELADLESAGLACSTVDETGAVRWSATSKDDRRRAMVRRAGVITEALEVLQQDELTAKSGAFDEREVELLAARAARLQLAPAARRRQVQRALEILERDDFTLYLAMSDAIIGAAYHAYFGDSLEVLEDLALPRREFQRKDAADRAEADGRERRLVEPRGTVAAPIRPGRAPELVEAEAEALADAATWRAVAEAEGLDDEEVAAQMVAWAYDRAAELDLVDAAVNPEPTAALVSPQERELLAAFRAVSPGERAAACAVLLSRAAVAGGGGK